MWSTIENFKESLSQITADVLDAAEELEPGGSELSTDGLEDSSHRQRRIHSPDTHHSQEIMRKYHKTAGIMKKIYVVPLDLRDHYPRWMTTANRDFEYDSKGELHSGDQILQNGKESSISILNGPPTKMREYQVENRKLQAREKDLLRQISNNKVAYTSLQDTNEKALAEIQTLKEALEKQKKGSSNARGQLQRNQKMLEEADINNRQMKAEKQKMAMEIAELHHKLAEQAVELDNARNNIRAEVRKEFEPTLLVKDEKVEQLQLLVKDLEKENLELQGEVTRLKQWQGHQENKGNQYNDNPVETKDSSQQAINAPKEAKPDFHLERRDYQKRIEALCAERDKAFRNLDRLKQHLIEKENSDTEKMERDGKLIKELQQKADASIMRAMRLEQNLAQTLATQEDVNKRNAIQLEEAQQENLTLKKKLSSCMSALESKDSELTNLQAALGQYYAESEAKERLHLELAATKNELYTLQDQLRIVNNSMEIKDKEKGGLLEKLILQQKKVEESEGKAHKLEADILMLRRALEQSLTRLNRMSSDSDYYVDRRIVIKLLVTYFQRHQSKEVLDLMARMLGFSDEEKRSIGVAQQGGKSMVRGVLGLPGRVVGGLLRTDSSSPTAASLQTDNQSSFSDLWIDFLLKESEERERRDTGMKDISAQDSANIVYTKSASESSSGVSATSKSGSTEDIPGNEFSVVPLNSTSVRNLIHPRT